MLWHGFGDSSSNRCYQFFPPDSGQQPDLPPESGQSDALGAELLTAPGAAVFLLGQHAGAAALPLTAPGAAALEQHALAQSEPHFLALASAEHAWAQLALHVAALSPTAPGAAVDWGLLQPARIAAAARATIERVVFTGRTPKFK